jgi:integrase
MVDSKPTRRPRVRRFMEGWLREQLGKRRSQREEWGDSDKPGLRARFGKSGSITWVFYRQAGGKQSLTVLGRYPELGLAAAREQLEDERSRARTGLSGLDQVTDYREMTVAGLVAKFVASLAGHRKHPRAAEKELDRYVLQRPRGFKNLRVRDVAKRAWHHVVEDIAADGHATQAARTHKLLGQMFNFAVQFGILEASPFQGLRPRSLGAVEAPPRQRVLSPDELHDLLVALAAPCPKDARVGRLGIQLLLLTGKRTGELLRAEWDHVDLEKCRWTIPAANRKANLNAAIGDEVVPLSPAAVGAFEKLREITGKGPDPIPAEWKAWVFRTPHSSSTGRLGDTALSRTVRELIKGKKIGTPHWTPHDLRRTARSYWSEKLGVPWDLAERLLGHALPKVARTYDTGTYLSQRREALEKWATYLERLASGNEAKVVSLPVGASR